MHESSEDQTAPRRARNLLAVAPIFQTFDFAVAWQWRIVRLTVALLSPSAHLCFDRSPFYFG